jgi:hypothetical protein
MLKQDTTLAKLMKPLTSPVDCHHLSPSWRSPDTAYRCSGTATHAVVSNGGPWAAMCERHATSQRRFTEPSCSFELEYNLPEPDPCLHLNAYGCVIEHELDDDEEFYRCDDCGLEF